ncbi:hypothetical protein F8388_005444 [Cannabis sativa]|uniref:Uncharacterized protein n=1 Tax=Cannabis sativa TaxID=3483 RepID=A0A7J6HB23_CANSA|nr:hypothetical protein F8388_005444 [Cannabis sativa]
MTSRALRRRLHHSDVDGKGHEHLSGLEGLDEPLLGNHRYDERHPEGSHLDDLLDDARRKEQLHWSFIFSQLIAQWAHWFANIVIGPVSFIGWLFTLTSAGQIRENNNFLRTPLSPLQSKTVILCPRRKKDLETYGRGLKSPLMVLAWSIK